MDSQVIGVKDFIGILNETLSFAYPQVIVEGEVSSFKVNQGKWVFFDLKDEEATLGCFMPLYQLKVPLENGMKVRATGQPRLTKWGKFSFTVKSIELSGEGELRRAFELLQAKLGEEGLFEPSRKRQLPRFPRTIGLITSAQSAAYSDFIKILGQRWGGVRVLLADVQVQGLPAPEQVVAAIKHFDQLPQPTDVLVLIRGGGSLEDLQAFNTEAVARAVASSRTPIVVGVGHEVDESLADYAADVRAATPTDAARLVVPDRVEVLAAVNHRSQQLQQAVNRHMHDATQQIQRYLAVTERFLGLPRARTDQLELVMRRELRSRMETVGLRLANLNRVLASFDPTANLRRGYAIVSGEKGIVRSTEQVKIDQSLVIQLSDGKLNSKVTDVPN